MTVVRYLSPAPRTWRNITPNPPYFAEKRTPACSWPTRARVGFFGGIDGTWGIFATSKTPSWPLRQGKKSYILKQWFVVEIMIKSRTLGSEIFVLATCSFQFANQGRQRRDAAVAEEEQLGRSKAGQFNLYSSELKVAALSLRRVRVACHNFAAGAPPLTHVYTAVAPSNQAECLVFVFFYLSVLTD